MAFDKITHYIMGLSVVCILLTIVAISAQAEDQNLPKAEPVAIQTKSLSDNPAHKLIRQQLQAIKSRDADLAYSLTTDGYHRKFGTAKEFLSHLRFQLRPIYNHENFTFLSQAETSDGIIQKVRMEDRYGDPVTVIYRLRKQESGTYLIHSFAVLALDAKPI